jgi:DNA mismatch endonuclease (patch repair protein)
VVFGPAKVAVFVDGCFWHVCPLHGTHPRANAEWWLDKLKRNVIRDRQTEAALTAAGWLVIRVWEHEEPSALASSIAAAVRARRPLDPLSRRATRISTPVASVRGPA